MEKSFYYSVSWSEANHLKSAIQALEIPFAIEQPPDLLADGHVAFVFPDLHVRVYNQVRELFGGHGRRYE